MNIVHPNISFISSLDFHEFLHKYEFYTHGISSYELKGSSRYLESLIPDLRHAKTIEEFSEILFTKIKHADKESMTLMIQKHVSTFKKIFNAKFTSNVYVDNEIETHELEAELPDGRKIKGHPFIIAMVARAVPVYNISMSRRERWGRNELADMMQKIVKFQQSLPEEDKHRLWIIADELNEIYEEGKTKDNAAAAFEELFRQGRPNNIGFIGNTQSLDKLNKEMYKNATHVICVHIQDDSERRLIGKTFGLPKEIYDKLGELEKQEIMVFSKEPFVVYDRWGRRKKVTERCWYKGKLFPPVNFHYVPKGE